MENPKTTEGLFEVIRIAYGQCFGAAVPEIVVVKTGGMGECLGFAEALVEERERMAEEDGERIQVIWDSDMAKGGILELEKTFGYPRQTAVVRFLDEDGAWIAYAFRAVRIPQKEKIVYDC